MAREHARPAECLSANIRKNDVARGFAEREGKQHAERVAQRKGVACGLRSREISEQAKARHPDTLAAVESCASGFESPMTGEHCLQDFTNRDVRSRLTSTRWLRA